MNVIIDGKSFVRERQVVRVNECSKCEDIQELIDELDNEISNSEKDQEGFEDSKLIFSQIEQEGFRRGLIYAKSLFKYHTE